MKKFEYAQPRTEREAVELLAETDKETAVLAGGTDLVGLMKRMVVTPDRVVNIREIDSLRHIESRCRRQRLDRSGCLPGRVLRRHTRPISSRRPSR